MKLFTLLLMHTADFSALKYIAHLRGFFSFIIHVFNNVDMLKLRFRFRTINYWKQDIITLTTAAIYVHQSSVNKCKNLHKKQLYRLNVRMGAAKSNETRYI